MTTSYTNLWNTQADPKPSVEDMKVITRGIEVPELLYDLLTTVSPHGKEQAVADIIVDFVKKYNTEAEIKFDAKKNLHIKVGKKPTTMFSSHMDTVQRMDADTTTLHLSDDRYVYASVPKKTEYYLDQEGERVSEQDIRKAARALGHEYTHYTMFGNNGVKTKRTLFGSNTQFDGWTSTDIKFTVNEEVVPTPCVLGADDKLGCYIMCHLIAVNTEGLYVFHIGEECGGIGSSYLASNRPDMFKGIKHCIAFDRMNYGDVITHQSGGRCCSDEFAEALSAQLNDMLPPMQQFSASTRGSFTDSANYTDLIPECTNVSVGYFSQHTANEKFDLEWLEVHLLPALLKVDWSDLPATRSVGKPDAPRFHRQGGKTSTGYSTYYGRRNSSYKGSRSVVPAGKSQAQKSQSAVDKFNSSMNAVHSFDPEEGFFKNETDGQKVSRVLCTLIRDDLSMSQIAELVVDTYKNARDRGAYLGWQDDESLYQDDFWKDL